MIRSIVFVSVGLIGCLPVFAKMSAEPGFETVPLRHVMYLHLQGASNDAYTQALVYERKYETAPVEPDENSQSQQQSPQHQSSQHQSSQRQSIRVTRAGIAIDLGWYGLVESIFAGTVSEQLAPVERDLLHFHLGRKAYRTQDWQQFEDEMASIESESTVLLTPQGRYLQAERARLNGKFQLAARLIAGIDKKNVLRRYSEFNLGVTSYAGGETALAKSALRALSRAPGSTVEQLLITERSRLALANIELQEVRFDQEFGSDKPLDGKRINRLRKLLDDITVTGPYGPAAISMLAQLAMGEGNYTRASELWYFAINNMPWHPAVRDAHVAMPYSLHQFRTDDQVYGEYTRAANRLGERQETLSALRQTMARLPPVELASALSFSNRRQARATLFALEENIGDDSLARWLADEESQRLANRWLRLNEAFSQLRSRQQNLDVLLAVDKEQQHRTRKAADRLKSDNLNLRLTRVEAKIVKLESSLTQLLEAVPTFDELRAVATPEEMNLVDQLDLLAQKATKLSAGASVLQRIEYLQGLLMYRVFTNLSVRVQNRQVEAERLTQLLTREKQRAIGIEQAAKNLSGSTSVSSKIKLLASRTNRLYHRTGTVLKDSSEQLLAHVNREISTEISALGEQLVYVRLAMARIDDRRLAISGVAP